jgi:hypothetical protein
MGLSEVLSRSPQLALQRLVEVSLRLAGAQSAGVSLEVLKVRRQ